TLPRPLTAVFVGGETKPFRFDAAVAATLLEKLRQIGARDGGTLYVSTSRRTRPEVVEALAAGLPPGAVLYRWAPDGAAANPYLGLLAGADRFVVTGDSVSMMVEVASLGKPLAIFALPVGRGLVDRVRAGLAKIASGPWLGGAAHLLHRLGIAGYARDLGQIQRLLIDRGLAVSLGQPFASSGAPLPDELAPVVARIRAMFA
ncbi:MAG: ELM1/GtrOC1 family putative glycosyltransferase, partial [Geminicoccaceae bacterium]